MTLLSAHRHRYGLVKIPNIGSQARKTTVIGVIAPLQMVPNYITKYIYTTLIHIIVLRVAIQYFPDRSI